MTVILSRQELKQIRGLEEGNPYFQLLTKQGIPVRIDKEYLRDRFLLRTDSGRHLGGTRDTKMGLVTENQSLRKGLAIAFTETVKRGDNWALMTVDLDQLKKANIDVERLFGDAYLRWGAVQVVNVLRENKQGENLLGKTIVYKEGTTSDEVKLWFFGVNDKELKEIKKLNKKINKRTQSVKILNKNNNEFTFNFSLSSGLVTSKDTDVLKIIDETIFSSSLPVLWNTFNLVNNLTDLESTRKKLIKDLRHFRDKIIKAQKLNNITELNKWIVEKYGDGRIKSYILKLILEVVEISVISYLGEQFPEQIEDLLKKLEITKKDLQEITTIKGLQRIFNKIFIHSRKNIIKRT